MSRATIYLCWAILGAVIPIAFFLDFFATDGINLMAFAQAVFVNGAAGGFTADLFISSFVFWMYMFTQSNTGPKPWLFIVLNLSIGLSCALPAYLWASEKAK